MKKTISVLLCLLMLTGCTRFNANSKVVTPAQGEESAPAENVTPQEGAQGGEESASEAKQSQAEQSVQTETGEQEKELSQGAEEPPYLTISPEDAFEEAYSFAAEETGSYRFCALESQENLSWELYVLEEEFDEASRYIPQANDPAAVLASGEEQVLSLQADEMVYCFCSVNSFTEDAPAKSGGVEVYFTPAEVENGDVLRAAGSGIVEVDAAECFEGGGMELNLEEGSYSVSASGQAQWELYVLDEPFEEALRYLAQSAEPALTGEGKLEVQAGEHVYCLCSQSDFTEENAPEEGAAVLHLEKTA